MALSSLVPPSTRGEILSRLVRNFTWRFCAPFRQQLHYFEAFVITFPGGSDRIVRCLLCTGIVLSDLRWLVGKQVNVRRGDWIFPSDARSLHGGRSKCVLIAPPGCSPAFLIERESKSILRGGLPRLAPLVSPRVMRGARADAFRAVPSGHLHSTPFPLRLVSFLSRLKIVLYFLSSPMLAAMSMIFGLI